MELNELQEQIKKCSSLSEINSIQEIDTNILFMSILASERYDLLSNNKINIHIDNTETSMQLIDYLLSDEDILYYMHRNGFASRKC